MEAQGEERGPAERDRQRQEEEGEEDNDDERDRGSGERGGSGDVPGGQRLGTALALCERGCRVERTRGPL